MKLRNIVWAILTVSLMAGCTSPEEEQADFGKTAKNLHETLEFVMAVRDASAKTGVEEEILYGITIVEGGRRNTYLDLTRPRRIGRIGLLRYQNGDGRNGSKFPLKDIFLAAANDLKHSYEVMGNWDLALLAWGSDDLAQVSLCLSDFPGGVDLEEFILDHLERWRTAPCFDGSSHQNFEGNNARTWARLYSVTNVRLFGAEVKSRIDVNYPRFDSPSNSEEKLPPLIITLECPNATASVLREGLLRAGCSSDGNPFANDVSGESIRFPELPPE